MLTRILTHKREEIERLKRELPLGRLADECRLLSTPRPLAPALRSSGRVALIAEIKPASPAGGVLAPAADAGALARVYEAAGAAAVSVLTDAVFFGAGPENLVRARRCTGLPLLHKEFVIDPFQLYLSRRWGADAVLLIVAALADGLLEELMGRAAALGLSCLVEVHTPAELEIALAAGADLIAVNNRNLFTMEVDPETTFRLLPRIDRERVTVVSASGITTRSQMERLAAHGVHAALVGTALMRHPDPARAIRELEGVEGDAG